MTFSLHNLQRGFRVDRRAFRALALGLARTAQEERPQPGAPWRALAVILTDDAGIAPFNRAVMGHTGATDVLTQRYEPVPGELPGLIGELVINVEQAWRAGARLARARSTWSPAHELVLYLAHGCDHLNDADDATPAGRGRMRRRELRWLAARNIPRRLLLRAAGRHDTGEAPGIGQSEHSHTSRRSKPARRTSSSPRPPGFRRRPVAIGAPPR